MKLTMKRVVPLILVAALVVVAALAYFQLRRGEVEWTVEVAVGESRRVFSLKELRESSIEVEVSDIGKLRCAPLSKLVAGCGIDFNKTLLHRWTAVGADGYMRSVDEAYLYMPGAYLCLASEANPDWGPVRLVVEGLSSKYWVKQLVRVTFETGPWVLNLKVDGETRKVFNLAELESLAVNVEGLGRSVPLSSLLGATGLSKEDVEVLEFIGVDGYRSVFHGSNVTRAFVLLIDPQDWSRHGPLRSAVLGAPKGTWVRHLVAVEVVTRS